ncbi:MAG: ATP synthase F1 subunit gamma [Oscillospiraceae bacterium]
MAGMREIKQRIKSINETKQITNAMKLISGSRLRKARQQLEQTKPFTTIVETTMADILAHSPDINSAYFDDRRSKKNKTTGILFMSGDKGLAGGYNHNIVKMAEGMMRDADNPRLLAAGRVGYHYCVRKHFNIDESFQYPVKSPTIYRAREIGEVILKKFLSGELDEVYMVFTEMVSPIKLVPQAMRLLPLNLHVLKAFLGQNTDENNNGSVINYEPSADAVFDVLVPKYVKGVIYGALVESYTSELSARMTAMDSSTANADKMLQNLNLYYNRARQAAITQEISEIVGGTAAL